MFGKLVFALCTNNLAAMNNFAKAVENVGRHYSAELKAVALFLVSKPMPNKVRTLSPPRSVIECKVVSRQSGICSRCLVGGCSPRWMRCKSE